MPRESNENDAFARGLWDYHQDIPKDQRYHGNEMVSSCGMLQVETDSDFDKLKNDVNWDELGIPTFGSKTTTFEDNSSPFK